MTTQLMIYETAVPISRTRHRNWSLDVGTDYSFCRKINSVPLMAGEFASAALEYAIVFGGADAVMPVAVLGVRSDENLFVTQQGAWQAKYIPAFVRRYPFVFSSQDDGKSFMLCIDEAFSGFNESGRGERLFDDEGQAKPYVENVLKFMQQYQFEFERTQAFCKKLKDLNLLSAMHAEMEIGARRRIALKGFSVVDRARLKTLSASVLSELAQSDQLELIYAHLLSMRNLATVKDWFASNELQTSAVA